MIFTWKIIIFSMDIMVKPALAKTLT